MCFVFFSSFFFFLPLSRSMFFILRGVYLMWQHRKKCRQPRLMCLGSNGLHSEGNQPSWDIQLTSTSLKGILFKWPLLWWMPRTRRGMKGKHTVAYFKKGTSLFSFDWDTAQRCGLEWFPDANSFTSGIYKWNIFISELKVLVF